MRPKTLSVESSNRMNPPTCRKRGSVAIFKLPFCTFVCMVPVHITKTERTSERNAPVENVPGSFFSLPNVEKLTGKQFDGEGLIVFAKGSDIPQEPIPDKLLVSV